LVLVEVVARLVDITLVQMGLTQSSLSLPKAAAVALMETAMVLLADRAAEQPEGLFLDVQYQDKANADKQESPPFVMDLVVAVARIKKAKREPQLLAAKVVMESHRRLRDRP
jgi:hypothetical protein